MNTEEPFYEQMKQIMDSMIKSGNRERVRIANQDYNIFADSAEEAWISYHLMERKNTICLKAFPRLQNPYLLEDTLLKVCNQNPYIIDIYSCAYDEMAYKKMEKSQFQKIKGEKDKWYQIDCSNNENTVLIPYFMYNVSEEQAEIIGYTIKKDALLDEEYVILSKQNQKKQKEYYLEKELVNMVRRLYMQVGRDGELKDLTYLYSNGYVVIGP